MIELLLSLGLNKYDTSKILPVKCYIDNFVCLWSYIRNINIHQDEEERVSGPDSGVHVSERVCLPSRLWKPRVNPRLPRPLVSLRGRGKS
jgi:hypothetical protein